MRIEEQTLRGYRTCARDRVGTGGCQGYESEEIDVVQETTSVTFGDVGSPAGDPYHPLLSHQHVRLRPAHERDSHCAHCGGPVSISLEPRMEYRRLSPAGPDQLVEQARLERERDQRAEQTLDAGERSARALERLAGSAAGSSELRELREELQQLRALMANGNGHPEPEGDPDFLLTSETNPAAEPEPEPDPPTRASAPRPRKRASS